MRRPTTDHPARSPLGKNRRKIVNNVVTKISTPYSTGHIPCPYGCGRSFKHATQKAIHIRKVHTGERPFVCKVEGCGKAFYSSGDLKSHEKTHSGLKPFECPTCGKALSSRNALKVHIKALHTLERPFKCEVPNCGMTYMTRLDLDRHMKKHVKWEQKEEKAKMANLEKRTEKAERKLRQVLEKQVKNQSGEARVSVNLSAGRLVALAPGEPPPRAPSPTSSPTPTGPGCLWISWTSRTPGVSTGGARPSPPAATGRPGWSRLRRCSAAKARRATGTIPRCRAPPTRKTR